MKQGVKESEEEYERIQQKKREKWRKQEEWKSTQANKGGIKENRKDESRGMEEGKGANMAYFRFGTVEEKVD